MRELKLGWVCGTFCRRLGGQRKRTKQRRNEVTVPELDRKLKPVSREASQPAPSLAAASPVNPIRAHSGSLTQRR